MYCKYRLYFMSQISCPYSLVRSFIQRIRPGSRPFLTFRNKYTFYGEESSPTSNPQAGPNILLITLFSNTLSLCSSLNVRDQVTHPYRTTGKIIVLYIEFNENRNNSVCIFCISGFHLSVTSGKCCVILYFVNEICKIRM
jgi:hypothetical protein